jgi:hypothetical protein
MPPRERAIITFMIEAKSGSAMARRLRFSRLTWRKALRAKPRNHLPSLRLTASAGGSNDEYNWSIGDR